MATIVHLPLLGARAHHKRGAVALGPWSWRWHRVGDRRFAGRLWPLLPHQRRLAGAGVCGLRELLGMADAGQPATHASRALLPGARWANWPQVRASACSPGLVGAEGGFCQRALHGLVQCARAAVIPAQRWASIAFANTLGYLFGRPESAACRAPSATMAATGPPQSRPLAC